MSWFGGVDPSGTAPTPTGAGPANWPESYWDSLRSGAILGYWDLTPEERALDPYVIRQKKAAEDQAAADAARQAAIDAARNATPYTPPPPAPPAPPTPPAPPPPPTPEEQRAKLRSDALMSYGGAFPAGFEQGLAPTSLLDQPAADIYGQQRAKADEFISNMLKRGVLTETGRAGGINALDTQAASVKGRISDIGNVLLEQERGKLRDIANQGKTAAGSLELGQTFDPNVYKQQANQSVSDFAKSLGDTYGAQVTGDLFDTSGVGAASGAVTRPTGEQFDPYAQEGGTLKSGLEDTTTTPKRRVSVF